MGMAAHRQSAGEGGGGEEGDHPSSSVPFPPVNGAPREKDGPWPTNRFVRSSAFPRSSPLIGGGWG